MKKKKYFLFLMIIIFFIVFQILGVFSFIENIGVKLLNPLLAASYSLKDKVVEFRTFVFLKNDLAKKIDELESRTNLLILENAMLKLEEKKNETLRKELNFLRDKKYDSVLVNTIGRLPEAFGSEEVLVIDQGENQGIEVGYPVIAAEISKNEIVQGFLVGKIIKTENDSAQVLLINNYQSSLAAIIISEKKEVDCLVKGVHSLSMQADFIPINEKIKEGDLVVSSGLEKYIPKGLVIGEVDNVVVEPNELFQQISVRPLVSLGDFKILSVLKVKNEGI